MKKLLRFDWASKYLFKNKSYFGILEGFLSELLLENLKIKAVLPSTNQINGSEEKSSRLDLLMEGSKGEFIIQLQNNRDSNYNQKMIFGSCKTMVENFQGYGTGKPKKLICVNIVYSIPGEGNDYVYRGRFKLEGLHRPAAEGMNGKANGHHYHTNEHKELFPDYYLIYIYNFKDQIKDSLDEWIYYLKHTEIKDSFTANGLRELRDRMSLEKLNDEERRKYETYLSAISSDPLELLQMKLKTETLLKEKEMRTKVEIAKALKGQFVPVEIISASTGLTIPEIKGL